MSGERRGGARGAVRALRAFAAVFVVSALTRAEEPAAYSATENAAPWLHWSPPPECPRADFVLDRVQSWLGGRLPAAGELEAHGEVQWTGEEWEIAVRLRVGETDGERRVRVATCGDAAEFLAVTIVLAVDPERGAALTRAVESPPVVSEAPPAKLESSAPPAESRPAQADQAARPVPPAPAVDARRRLSWLLGASVEGALGPLPSFQAGPAIEVGLRRGLLVVTAGARFLPPVAQRPEGAVADISYALAAGRLGACVMGDLGFAHLGPCVGVDVGALWTQQAAPGDVSETVPWVDVQAGAAARFLGPRLSLTVGARLSVPVTQPLFVVSSGETVHQPTVGLVFDLGLQVFFGPK